MPRKTLTPGAAFEAATAKQLAVLATQIPDFAWRPLREPARQVTDRRTGKARFVRPARERHPGDFEACIPPDGRALFIECKSTAAPRLAIGERGLKLSQLTLLIKWAGAGAKAGVLWQCRDERAPYVWWLDARLLVVEFARDKKSITAPWADEHALLLGTAWRWSLLRVWEDVR